MSLELKPPRAGKTPFWYVRGTYCGRAVDASTKARDKKAAQRFKEQLERRLATESAKKFAPATFGIAAQMYKEYRRPSKPFQKSVDRLAAFLGNDLLTDINLHTLINAANVLSPGTSPATKNRDVLVPASAVLHYAAENNLGPYIRVKKFKEKAPEPRALTKPLAKALMGAAEGPMKLLLVWLFHQGWRISDVLRVTWKDIDLKEGTVRYHISKTDDWRVMPLHPKVQAILAQQPAAAGRVFHWGNKSNLYRELRPFCKRLDIRFTPHMARHSFATWLANEGVSPMEIMEAGGWKDHKSVMRYAKLDPTRVRAVIGKI